MTPFDWAEPNTIIEAISLLDAEDPSIRPVAGGTALMLMMKAGVFQPTRLISLQRIEPEFSQINGTAAGELHIGALVSLSAIEQSSLVAKHSPALRRAMIKLSNVRVRNVARVGGALAHGDPHMDLPPVLSALGARAVIKGPNATREIPVEDLFVGYYETVLARNELIAKVIVPAAEGRCAAYAKVTTRAADDWPALGVAVSILAEDNLIRDAKVIVSAATEKVTRLTATEQVLKGAASDAASLRRAGEAAAAEAPLLMDDAQGSAAYKRELLQVYVGRAVRQALSNTVH
jgi:carbon-monoxide dehydrogenase medium subunit